MIKVWWTFLHEYQGLFKVKGCLSYGVSYYITAVTSFLFPWSISISKEQSDSISIDRSPASKASFIPKRTPSASACRAPIFPSMFRPPLIITSPIPSLTIIPNPIAPTFGTAASVFSLYKVLCGGFHVALGTAPLSNWCCPLTVAASNSPK
ncbi:uncharacterized protein [Spinacia oleracea]|uniref:Uncharacterized protein LOC110802869 n=1 Tax=Spinacia oleracea TaxID=3562 RepID=A0A9R0JCI9_SPIOL|nr:uncharacterized protein LOC110802869 [Spinacia oleracea]XP_056682419.1 uncharacterized protein LOC130459211 [Spinacia oleracea]XP_056691463.1 uncharacterized protein LOC130466941 [Spinacia oleracea]